MTPQELKNSILQLAIQGKLVPQDPSEGTGEELYRQIQEEKSRLIKEGKIKKEKPLAEITEDEIPFEIPESWKWVRLGTLLRVIGGVSYDKKDVATSGIRILRGGNIQQMRVLFEEDDVFLPEQYRDEDKTIREGDILIVASTGSKTVIGKAGYVDRLIPDTMIGAFLRICRSYCFYTVNYLRCLFDSEFYRKHIRELSQGTNINNVKESYITEFAVPLPPLAEQKRIVAKLEEILPLIDRYEKAYTRLENLNARFPLDMQKSILQMAIQGKLVEQRPEEGTGEELYRHIQIEKAKLIKEGKIKKGKPLAEISEDEIPFEIPANWIWCHIPDVCYFQEGPGIMAKDFRTTGIPLIRIAGMQGNYVSLQGCNYLDPDMVEGKWNHFKLDVGDIVISTSASLDKIAEVDNEAKGAIPYTGLIRFKMFGNLSKEFFTFFIKSPCYINQISQQEAGSTIKHYGPTHLKKMVIPLPPLAEQKRIVAKLEEILPLCERVK